MIRINFRRKKSGSSAWGVGLDYLLKDSWNDLDKIIEDNYYGRHNKKLINYLFPKVFSALQEAILKMKRFSSWIKKAEIIQRFGASAKSLSEKVVFIDAVTQFLRETSLEKIKVAKKVKVKRIIEKSGIKEIKGVIASGQSKNISGVVKIVLSEKDFSKIKKDNILVAKETSASFLPVMEKAAAFITDFGGILSHAAIVAREFKKVCLVGTKIATQVLKDGDLVEINAKKGVVKILKGKWYT